MTGIALRATGHDKRRGAPGLHVVKYTCPVASGITKTKWGHEHA